MTAELLLHLGEVDARKLYLGRAFPSMFAFCVGSLGLSEDATCNLLTVARLVRRLPAALEALRDGRVHLTGLRLLAPHFTAENVDAVLAEATGRSKRDVEEIVARFAPKPAVPDAIRKLPQPAARSVVATEEPTRGFALDPPVVAQDLAAVAPEGDENDAPAAASSQSVAALLGAFATVTPSRRAAVTPLAPETYKVQFTASRALRDKLDEAQGLLRHSIPDGALAAVIERALDCLLADVKKKRFGVGCVPRPRRVDAQSVGAVEESGVRAGVPARGSTADAASVAEVRPSSRHVPVDIRRAVHARDEGRCTFVDDGGRRCSETGGLEFDHVDGFARTHSHSVDGLRLRCAPHNQYGAELLYGRAFMETARGRAGKARARVSVPERTNRDARTNPVLSTN